MSGHGMSGRGMATLAPSGERLAEELSHRWAVEQAQQSLEFAAIVRSDGKSASIKSISECIQSSNAMSFSICILPFFSCSISFSSCFALCSERAICISLAGSRRQLSIDKKERKGDSDEPDAPLLLERELTVGEVDVVIGGKESNQANNAADDGFNQGLAVEPQPPPGRRRFQIPRESIHPTQPALITTIDSIVRMDWLSKGRRGFAGGHRCSSSSVMYLAAERGLRRRQSLCPGRLLRTLQESSENHTTCGVCFGGPSERRGWHLPGPAPGSPAPTRATPVITSTTIPTGFRTCGACVPMQSWRRACSMPAAFRWASRVATTASPMAQPNARSRSRRSEPNQTSVLV